MTFRQRTRAGLLRAVLLGVPALGLGMACQPQIGDACRTSQNCRPGHLCDTSVDGAGGYCTIFDCRPDECPSGSVCVTFDDSVSACLAKCDRDRDCRPDDGFVCRADVGDTRFCYVAPSSPES